MLSVNINLKVNYCLNKSKSILVGVCHGTFVILPPLKLAKRFSARVSTLALRWMVNLFEAVTIFLHLQNKNTY